MFNFLIVLERIAAVVIILAMITQVIIPGLRGRPWWPIFRKRAKIEENLTEVREEIDTERLHHQELASQRVLTAAQRESARMEAKGRPKDGPQNVTDSTPGSAANK